MEFISLVLTFKQITMIQFDKCFNRSMILWEASLRDGACLSSYPLPGGKKSTGHLLGSPLAAFSAPTSLLYAICH